MAAGHCPAPPFTTHSGSDSRSTVYAGIQAVVLDFPVCNVWRKPMVKGDLRASFQDVKMINKTLQVTDSAGNKWSVSVRDLARYAVAARNSTDELRSALSEMSISLDITNESWATMKSCAENAEFYPEWAACLAMLQDDFARLERASKALMTSVSTLLSI